MSLLGHGKIIMFESLFIFDRKSYEQYCVAMCHFENVWLENCSSYLKPIVHRQFADNTFLLFRSKDTLRNLELISVSYTKS